MLPSDDERLLSHRCRRPPPGVGVWVSTENDACRVYFLGSNETFDNWDAYVAAHADPTVASKGDFTTPYIVADIGPATYTLSAIDLQ